MGIGWAIFIFVVVLGLIISNVLLLKQCAHIKVPDSVIEAVKARQQREREEEEAKKNDQ
jgi:hypothetical protein